MRRPSTHSVSRVPEPSLSSSSMASTSSSEKNDFFRSSPADRNDLVLSLKGYMSFSQPMGSVCLVSYSLLAYSGKRSPLSITRSSSSAVRTLTKRLAQEMRGQCSWKASSSKAEAETWVFWRSFLFLSISFENALALTS